MTNFHCPYLGGDVELTDERERHIAERHPDLLPRLRDLIGQVLADPDQVRKSDRSGSARLFSKTVGGDLQGRNLVVVVVSEVEPMARHWVVTAYQARKLSGGEAEWMRS